MSLDVYTGYENLILTEEEIAKLYEGRYILPEILENQYLLIRNKDNKCIDKFVKKGNDFLHVSYQKIKTPFSNIRPRNLEQELAFNMLQDPQTKIKLISGRFGSGKDYCMLSEAVELIRKEKFEKLVFVRNNVEVRDSEKLGSLPGDQNSKLMPYLMVLADHLGGVKILESYLEDGTIEPIHLGFLRGRDLKNSIIYCTEGQNLSVDHMKLLVGRVGEGSELWINADFKAQVDREIFEKNSGVKTLINKLKGNPYFGYVHLVKSERSEVAALADLLD